MDSRTINSGCMICLHSTRSPEILAIAHGAHCTDLGKVVDSNDCSQWIREIEQGKVTFTPGARAIAFGNECSIGLDAARREAVAITIEPTVM